MKTIRNVTTIFGGIKHLAEGVLAGSNCP